MKAHIDPTSFERYLESGALQSSTLLDCLGKWAVQYGERTALQDDCERLTYRQLDQRSTALASLLKARGLVADDKVILQLPNSCGFCVALFAVMKLGGVAILALPGHRQYELLGLQEAARATMYITCSELAGFRYEVLAQALVGQGMAPTGVIYLDTLEEATWQAPVTLAAHSAAPDDVAFLLLSGGTTQVPKLIPRTHADYTYNVTAMAEACGLNAQTRYLCVVPVAHNFALGCPGVLGVLSVGGFVHMLPQPDIMRLCELLIEQRITVTSLVPSIAEIMIEYLELDDLSFDALELVQVGAARFSKESARRLKALLGCELQHIYGMAEGLLCFNRAEDSEDSKVNTQGRPLSVFDEIRVVGEGGQQVALGEAGELHVRGPYTIRGYHARPEINAAAFDDEGFYRTGDIVRVDQAGNVTVVGRAKEQINRAGEKYSPSDMEKLMLDWSRVGECAVVGIEDRTLGERVVYFIRPIGPGPSRRDVCDYLKGLGLADFKYPDEVVLMDQLPLTAVGKIDKKRLLLEYP
ncbi:(2,3-dihydroxybenzoyl)adenylate synthase [Pseudomonas promysalinigenes]|uniref:salicylate--[aryl-carrier protein] ligase n=1 Tax=Pseudomonas putida TaxID=303 RepID=G8AA91_PSEPU|nr:AMP-binding protein [Pseudomonas promysalinigenes]ADQ74621.1 salicylyl-AMP ligase [Pseudomonas putida]QXI32358.1 AMP-binding protein [Pseudomonas promysalinigenes]